eukprot:9296714-Pyramimonas_sp.AAC.1
MARYPVHDTQCAILSIASMEPIHWDRPRHPTLTNKWKCFDHLEAHNWPEQGTVTVMTVQSTVLCSLF